MSHDIVALYGNAETENYGDYWQIPGTRGARDVAISAIRDGMLVFSDSASEILDTMWYHLCRTDHGAAG